MLNGMNPTLPGSMQVEIIGEKINGTRKRVARAIQKRDADFILDLAVKQAEAGATWLDVNAGTLPAREPEDLIWLVQTIQPAVQTPLCLDSANPAALAAALEIVDQTPLINSISGEQERLDGILPLAAQYDCPVVALAMSDAGGEKESKLPSATTAKVCSLNPAVCPPRTGRSIPPYRPSYSRPNRSTTKL